MTAHYYSGTTGSANGIKLINKDDTWRLFTGLLKQFPHPGRPNPYKHLNKFGTGNGKKRNPGLTGNRPGQQGLARTRRADHKHALGHSATDTFYFARILEKIDGLLKLHLGLFSTGHIIKGHHGQVGFMNMNLVADIEKALAHVPHPLGHPAPEQKEQAKRKHPAGQKLSQPVIPDANRIFHPVCSKFFCQIVVLHQGDGNKMTGLVGLVL